MTKIKNEKGKNKNVSAKGGKNGATETLICGWWEYKMVQLPLFG